MKNLSKFFLAGLFAFTFFGPIHRATQPQLTSSASAPASETDPPENEPF